MSSLLIAGSKPVPQGPPLEKFVGPDYHRYDGLDELGQSADATVVSTSLGISYGEQPDPGRLNAPFTRANGIAGKVGSVGAAPYPVETRWGLASDNPDNYVGLRVSQLTTQFRHGPGGAAPGLAHTVEMTRIQSQPPQTDDLSLIYLFGGPQ